MLSPKEMKEAAERYFSDCPDKKTVHYGRKSERIDCFTRSGLAIALGFDSWADFIYQMDDNTYLPALKWSKTMLEKTFETEMRGAASQTSGAIFALTNLGWTKKEESLHQVSDTQKEVDDAVKSILEAVSEVVEPYQMSTLRKKLEEKFTTD